MSVVMVLVVGLRSKEAQEGVQFFLCLFSEW